MLFTIYYILYIVIIYEQINDGGFEEGQMKKPMPMSKFVARSILRDYYNGYAFNPFLWFPSSALNRSGCSSTRI